MAHIKKRGDNSYRITIYNNGERIRKTIKAESKTEAKRKAAIMEAEIIEGTYNRWSEMKLTDFFIDKWFKQKKHEIEKKTQSSYSNTFRRYVKEYLGHIKLVDLEPMDFIDLYEKLRDERDLSGRTVNNVHKVLNIMFNDAVKWELIEKNPLKNVDAPKYKSDTKNFYTLEQIDILLKKLDEEDVASKYRIAVYLALFCGLRLGEILGLRWQDIDFENDLLTVKETKGYAEGEEFVKKPKNKSSERQVYFSQMLRQELLNHKGFQENLKDCVKKWHGSNRLLTTNNGKDMSYHTLGKWLRRFRKRHELDRITLHGLRHTAATQMIGNGTNLKTVSDRLGHADAKTTLSIYAHSLKKPNKKAADDLENTILNKNEKDQ